MFLGIHAAQAPDRPAVIMAGRDASLTYGELEENSRRLAHRLRAQGLRRGDVIGLLSGNDVRVFEVYWAAQRTGLYVTAINTPLSPDEIRHILEDSGAEALVVGPGIGELASGLSTHAGVRYAVAMDGAPDDGGAWHDYADQLAAAPDEPLGDQPRGGDMLYSSGTTGRPKGIRPPLPDRQVDEPGDTMVALFGDRIGPGPDTVYLSPAPLVGDISYVDEDGYLYLTDRKAFLIISGGVNIYPQEIEDALALHPAVADVAVIGIPDDEMGEQVKAVVQTAHGVEAGEELAAELVAHVRSRLAGYEVPRSVDFVDELPRTPTGKLVKGPLRDRYRTSATAVAP